MDTFQLSASLEEHDDDVRGVVFPSPSCILSASRDSTVRLWKLLSTDFEASVISHGSSFVNAITFYPPSPAFSNGLVISGGKDTIIEVRQPGNPPEQNAEALLVGHAHNVCALDVCVEGEFLVSGSWDGTARVWSVGKWNSQALLQGHEGSVWAVLAFDRNTIITGCADKLIRIFDTRGKVTREIRGSTDVVRALCRVPSDHPMNADFASAGNDGVIRLWKLDGRQIGSLTGHENFIYSLVSLPTGELVSSGEDRTVRIWRGQECIQTITHPAISVWSVGACSENGDIVSGASDRKVRVFTRAKDREAKSETIRAFENSVKSSSIPRQQVGNINKEKLPGPGFLQEKSGTKEGQVAMIQEANGSVSAHQWSQGSGKWMSVGTVVDAVGSSGKKTSYAGNDYDYVFDVDIEDGKPPLKLPYNLAQNPYEAATHFIQHNELPMTYLDQVADFITTNTQGAKIGQSAQGLADSGPWASGAYQPGDASIPQSSQGSRSKVLPQATFLSIKTANVRKILDKVSEINQQLINEGLSDIALVSEQMALLEGMGRDLGKSLSEPATTSALTEGISVVFHMVLWPAGYRLPALDLLRLLAAATPAVAENRDRSSCDVVDMIERGGFEDKDRDNNTMLGIRAFGNLFETKPGRKLVDKNFSRIHRLIQSSRSSTNRNLNIALSTLYLNYAVLFTSPSQPAQMSLIDRGLVLLEDLTTLLSSKDRDPEAVYRGLVAIGTLLDVGEEISLAAKEVYGLEGVLKNVESSNQEPRIKGVVAEIQGRLRG